MSSPRSMRGSSVRFCSSVPCSMIAGAMFDRPSGLSVPGAPRAVHLLGEHDLLHDARRRARPTPRATRSRRSARRRACGSSARSALERARGSISSEPPSPSPRELVGEVGRRARPGTPSRNASASGGYVKSISRRPSVVETAAGERVRRSRAACATFSACSSSVVRTRPSTLSSPMMWTSPRVSLM